MPENQLSSMVAHEMHHTIVREYDIRGIVGETLFTVDARAIGRSFGTVLRRQGGSKVAVGFDGRLTSPTLVEALVQGLAESGVDVIKIGRGPTPMLYYAAYTRPVDGGVMVTGSHNPPGHNGFKFVLDKKAFFGEALRDLAKISARGDFEEGEGAISDHLITAQYLERLLQDVTFDSLPCPVVWDAGNGATGEVLEGLVARLPGEHHCLFTEINGAFPNHHPDPTVPENLVDLQRKLNEVGAGIGIAFDGDGDRLGLVDERGRMLFGDQIMLLLALDILKEKPGATFVADVKTSQVFFDEIEKAGGQVSMWKTGHSHIKNKMAEIGAPFAGEMSAHLFFADRYYGYDDALYAAIRVLNILARSGQSLSAFHDTLPKVVSTPEIRFDIPEDRKLAVVEEVAARLKNDGAEVCDVDGVRVSTTDGWWLLRASNTQAVLVARCEAREAAGLERLKQILAYQLRESGVEAPPLIKRTP